MKDEHRTKEQLVKELVELRQRITELEASETERKRTEEALKESEERSRQAASSLREAVWLRDTQTLEILYVNPAYEKIWGRTCESFYENPTSFFDAVYPEDKEWVMKAIKDQYQGIFFDEEYRIVRPDGSIRWVWGRTFPIKNEAGEVYRVTALAEDITERKRAEEALRQYTVELETRNEELDAFAHTVAHDLKGPLAPLLAYAEMLEENHTSLSGQNRREHLHVIVQHGRKMSRIIDELLLLAEVRKIEVPLEPLDMASIVAEAQGRVAYLIEEHQAEIISPDTWPVALAYGPWVEQVWVNYLSNAIKYGGRPPRVELGATGQADGMVRFWVRDNGPGLTPEEQARLFTPFTQLAQVPVKGHGLGLSIVRRIVEKFGGQIGVESEVGQGSVFTFTLPGMAS
jgi:PAS domain S-box-containing protein